MTTAAGRLRAPAGHHSSGSQVRQPLRRGTPRGQRELGPGG
jgi:hypothetical protein